MDNKQLFDNYLTNHYADTEKVNFANTDEVLTHLKKNVGPLNRNLLQFFQAKIAKNSPILDLGCGYGSFLYFLQSHGYTNVTGVDISSEEIALCKKLFPAYTLPQADIHDYLQSSTETFDVIYLSHVLEHIPRSDLFMFLGSIQQRLTKGGYFIIVVPNSAAYFNAAANRYGDLTHEIGFTQLNLKQALLQTDFTDIRISNFFGVGNPLLNIARGAARFVFEIFVQLLGFDKQDIYTPSLMAIVRK